MKVLHFFKTYYPDNYGGVEQVIFHLAEGGRPMGIEAEVLFLSARGTCRGELISHHFTHRSKLDLYVASTGFSLSAFRDFKELAQNADIIHYHFPWPFMDVVHFYANMGKPTILTYHSDIVKQKKLLSLYKPLMRRFLKSVDKIVVTSPNYLKTSPHLDEFKNKISVIPLGLNSAEYPAASVERLAGWRARLGERFFLFIGAIRYYKGLHFLLDALDGVDYPTVIVGSGPMEEELKDQALHLGLKNIRFMGALPDVDKFALLELAYGFVFPSHLRSEAFGLSLLEGAMYGKPLISCEIGSGTTYINIHDDTGLVVPPADPKSLRNAMQFLWDNPDQSKIYGNNARRRYLQHFTADRMVERYSRLYENLHCS